MWLAKSHTHGHTIKALGAFQISPCCQGYPETHVDM